MKDPAVGRIRDLLIYDPATGLFSWRDTSEAAVSTPNAHGHLTLFIDGSNHYAHRVA